MKLAFCDLCSESVPQTDLDGGRATRVGGRIVCASCNEAMGVGPPEGGGGDVATAAGSVPETRPEGPPGETPKPAAEGVRRAERGLPNPALLAATLLVCGAAATVFLIVRIEQIATVDRDARAGIENELRELRRRDNGLKTWLANEVRRRTGAVNEVDVVKLGRMEQTLEAVRRELGLPEDAAGNGGGPGMTTPREREAREMRGRIEALEEQVLFLQSQLFELESAQTEEEPEIGAGEPAGEPAPEPRDEELESLGELLRHPDPATRAEALFTLGRSTSPEAQRHVARALEDRDPFMRTTAARTLERLRARESVPSLIAALADADLAVRDAAVAALRGLTGKAFLYDPRATATERDYAIRRWQDWWDANWKEFLHG